METLYAAESVAEDEIVAVAALGPGTRIDPGLESVEPHPNIVGIREILEEDGLASYVVMDLPPGRSLADVLAEQDRLEPGDALSIALQILSGLRDLHGRGRVHANLDPGNVFVERGPEGDLLATLVHVGPVCAAESANRPHCLAPEQLAGVGDVGRAADVWAVGVLLYEMLTGRHPFAGRDLDQVRSRIVDSDPDFEAVADMVPRELVGFIEQALQKKPARRFQDVANAIRRLLPLFRRFSGRMDRAAAEAQRDSLSLVSLPGGVAGRCKSSEPQPAVAAGTEPVAGEAAVLPPPLAVLSNLGSRDEPAAPAGETTAAPEEDAPATIEEEPSPVADAPTEAAAADIDIEVDVSDYELQDFTDLVEEAGPDSIIPPPAEKPATPEPAPTRGLSRRGLIAGAAVLAVVAFVVAALVLSSSDEETDAPEESERIGHRTADRPPAADEQGAAAATPEAKPPASEPEDVSITLTGLPQGAEIEVDGRIVPLPIIVPKSTKPIVLEVRAAGYKPFEERVVPDRHREFAVALKAKPKPAAEVEPAEKKPATPSTKPKKKGKRAGKKKKTWAANPFKQ